jgi:Flp pilus assembly protein TadG
MISNLYDFALRLTSQERGTSIIEMGAIVPLICFLIVGVIDLSMGYSHRLGLEAAAERTLANGISKGQDVTSKNFDYLKAEAATAAGVSQNNVILDFWLECNGARKTNYTDVCAANEQFARYLSIKITDTFHPIIGRAPFAAFYGGSSTLNGNVSMAGDAVARIQ